MKRILAMAGASVALLVLCVAPVTPQTGESLPAKFDLRTVNAVTPIKQQLGGTCWTHGTVAAIESNLLRSGKWQVLGHKGEPAISEYHLDWWNGFNRHKNEDVGDAAKEPSGLRVHQGGDYRVAAAYISRGDGVVLVPPGKDGSPDTKGWYKEAPPRTDPSYKRLYVRNIEWFTIGDNLENIDTVKRRLMTEGALGTAYTVNGAFMSKDFVQYQPKDNARKPNHAVAIVGWDDTKVGGDDKKAPKPGAWLIKNSWGEVRKNKKTGKEGPVGEKGYMWISYYDKVCCRDPEMGAVSFRNVEPLAYDHIYFHDYHGWRDTLKHISKAFNAFTATGNQQIRAVSFYTAKDNVGYTVKIYRSFENGKLLDEVASKTGAIQYTGFHTINLDAPVSVKAKDKFYVALDLTGGGQAIDRTSEIPVLLEQTKQPAKGPTPGKGPNGPLVLSKANPGESYYFDGSWKDLYEYRFENPNWATFDRTANFCMKALAVNVGPDTK
ncbi:MAG TPA: lectin like domain-containing protein [Gemmataceae bacterium]|nr:lectin like domain-containing protein [Gemmataceae bacterium]